ncbi:chorismate synthase [Bartonella sp. DGB1]|uniref:chorismate synthase n=1 Tax=Bartonella sp. DGB1 TaxID=3239807 RepID=UPI0035248B16
MSHNSFGHLFRVTTWGESHSQAIGCVIDGCPPNINFTIADIQKYLDERRPGQSIYTTQRAEPDEINILSGVISKNNIFTTLGSPISLMIKNYDQRPKDYENIADNYRPGHADYSYYKKYNIHDTNGGGRSSARETAMRVAAGAIARKILPQVKIKAAVTQIGEIKINRNNWNWNFIKKNPLFLPDPEAVEPAINYLNEIIAAGTSVGGIIEIVAENVPIGLGAPVYGKLDQDLSAMIMSINAVKAVEIGDGFLSAQLQGHEHNDLMTVKDNKEAFLSNHSGGIIGGISTGEDIRIRFAVKPTSSISIAQSTIDKILTNTTINIKGRHDPCIAIRAVAVGKAMVACVLADHFLRHRGQIGL